MANQMSPEELARLEAQLTSLADKLQQQQRLSVKVNQDQLDQFDDITSKLEEQVRLYYQSDTALKKLVGDARDFVTVQDAINKKLKTNSKGILSMARAMNGLVSELDRFVDMLPGGKILTELLGVNDLRDNLQEALDVGIKTLGESLANGADEADALQAAAQAFTGHLAVGRLAALGLVAAIGALVTLAVSLEKQFAGIAKETGITVSQSEELAKSSQAVANRLDAQLITMGDVLAVQKATIKEFGTMAMITPEIAAEVANIGEAFGYGAEEAAKVNNALLGLGVPAKEAADAQRELAAEALKAGVNVGTVTADIATNAKSTAKFFGGNVKALTNAAVEAAKLGVSLDQMVKTADSLLDIESSLANQFEFMALTGKEINFDEARRLAANNDIAGATKLILDGMGGIAEFQEMDTFQKEAAAKAAGMSVEELSKSLAIQEKLGDATADQLAAAQGLGLTAAEIANLSDEDLQTRLEQEQSAKKLNANFTDLGNELKLSLLPVAESLLAIISAISPVLKVVGILVKAIMSPLIGVYEMFDAMYKILTGSTDQLSAMGEVLGVVGIALAAIGSAIAIGFLPAIISAAYGALAMAGSLIAGAFAALGPFGIPLGIAAIAGLASMVMPSIFKAESAGDMFSPADGRTQISTKEGGLFQLSKNDDVIAAPGLANAMAGITSPETIIAPPAGTNTNTAGSTDMSTTNALLNQLVNNISALSNRPVQIVIGGRVVDEIKAQADINSTYVVGAG